jgi:hypothetical protein
MADVKKSETVKVVLNVNTGTYKRGDKVEVDKATAERLVANGQAREA